MSILTASVHSGAFIHDCLATITQLIPGTAAVYYLVDSHLVPQQHVLSGISAKTHQDYLQQFINQDPLHPKCYNHLSATVVTLDDSVRSTAWYRQFMLPNALRDMADIYVRQRKRIVAGLSIMRDRPFTLNERLRLRASLPLIELATEELMPSEQQCRLTPKEQQVVEMVRAGACNKRIASYLDISLSTVKTHLRNIFTKTSARSRTELVASLGVTYDRDYQL